MGRRCDPSDKNYSNTADARQSVATRRVEPARDTKTEKKAYLGHPPCRTLVILTSSLICGSAAVDAQLIYHDGLGRHLGQILCHAWRHDYRQRTVVFWQANRLTKLRREIRQRLRDSTFFDKSISRIFVPSGNNSLTTSSTPPAYSRATPTVGCCGAVQQTATLAFAHTAPPGSQTSANAASCLRRWAPLRTEIFLATPHAQPARSAWPA